MSTRSSDSSIERRAFKVDGLRLEARAAEGESQRLVGHASVFNTEVDIGGWFLESVAPGAFRRAIAEDDVRALFNHDANFVLGRNRAGTLRMGEDEIGLAIDCDPPDTQTIRDLVLAPIARGDVSQMSIGFRVRKQEWDETGQILKRRILEVELFDVSPVTFPAFPTTDIALRSLDEYRKANPKGGGITTGNAGSIVRNRAQRGYESAGYHKA